MNTLALAILSIVMSVAAQFSLKAGMSDPSVRQAMGQSDYIAAMLTIACNRYVVAGFALYGLGAVVWLSVLSRWEVSRAYPLVGLGFVLTAVVGGMLGENVTVYRLVGIALISVGVFLVGKY
jgi:multidrug transporter EmrE-like cation transporter